MTAPNAADRPTRYIKFVDDPSFSYPSPTGRTRRHLRAWRAAYGDPDPLTTIVVLTERRTDTGMTITNAAADILRLTRRAFPADTVRVIEQWIDNEPPASRYSWVRLDPDGRPAWRHLPDDEAHALLPELADDEPTPPDVWAPTVCHRCGDVGDGRAVVAHLADRHGR